MEAKNCLYREAITSGLGVFELRIDATSERLSTKTEGSVVVVQSAGHLVTIKKVTAPTAWLPTGMSVDTAMAWLVYITKHTEVAEQLSFGFTLPAMPSTVQAGANTGEWLTAVEFEDGSRQVHIGTQDEEWLVQSSNGAWMPPRLVSMLNNGLIITEIKENGLVTTAPELLVHEQFYLHYILAESARQKSAEYPDEWDVSTWYAVDQSRKSLEEAWNNETAHSDNTI
jgi:hypothetical protein